MELRKIYVVAGLALIMLILAIGLTVLCEKIPPLTTDVRSFAQSTEELN